MIVTFINTFDQRLPVYVNYVHTIGVYCDRHELPLGPVDWLILPKQARVQV